MAEISPLRRRMIEDMTIRNLSPATQQSYYKEHFACNSSNPIKRQVSFCQLMNVHDYKPCIPLRN